MIAPRNTICWLMIAPRWLKKENPCLKNRRKQKGMEVRLSLLSIGPQIRNSTIGPFIATLLPGDRNHSFLAHTSHWGGPGH